MSDQPTTPYADSAPVDELHRDCRATEQRLGLAARRAVRPAPSIHYDEQPRETAKRDIAVPEAAARLAAAIYGD